MPRTLPRGRVQTHRALGPRCGRSSRGSVYRADGNARLRRHLPGTHVSDAPPAFFGSPLPRTQTTRTWGQDQDSHANPEPAAACARRLCAWGSSWPHPNAGRRCAGRTRAGVMRVGRGPALCGSDAGRRHRGWRRAGRTQAAVRQFGDSGSPREPDSEIQRTQCQGVPAHPGAKVSPATRPMGE